MAEETKPQPEASSQGTDLSLRDTAITREAGIRKETDILLQLTREALRNQPSLVAGIIVPDYMSELHPHPENTEVLYGQKTRHLSVGDALNFDSGIRVAIVRATEMMKIEGKEFTLGEFLADHTVFPVLPNHILGGIILKEEKLVKIVPTGRLMGGLNRAPMLDSDFPGDESLEQARRATSAVLDAYRQLRRLG